MKLLFEASAPVRADIDDVERLIDDGWVLRRFLGSASQSADDAVAYVDVDHAPRAVGFQGHGGTAARSA